MQEQIHHLRHHQIDKHKWDVCIASSPDSLIYGYSWYLDSVSPNWEALVYGDYKTVMPLTIKKMGLIKIGLQPMFTQQLGVFSQVCLEREIELLFQKKLSCLTFNYQFHQGHTSLKNVSAKRNYVLNLNKPYASLTNDFSQNTRRSIAKAVKNNLQIGQTVTVEQFLTFYKTHYQAYLSDSDYQKLTDLAKILSKQGKLAIYACSDNQNNWLAMVMILNDGKRIIYHSAISNSEGYKKLAMFYLVDQIIRHFSETNTILDFEGSEIEGIARFYKGFGAKNSPYFVYENKWMLTPLKWTLRIKQKLLPLH